MNSKYSILNEVNTFVRRFNLHGKNITFKINEPPEGIPEFEWLEEAIKEIIELVKVVSNPTDKIGFTFSAHFFKDSSGYIPFKSCQELDSQDVWSVIFSVLQSNKDDGIKTTDTFKLHITRVEMPKGSGKRKTNFYNNFQEECTQRKGIVTIKNDDNLCLPRAIVVAKAYAKKDPQYRNIQYDTGKLQTVKTKKLLEKSGVIIPETGAGIPELQKFQDHLKKYKITVYKYGTKGRDLVYEGSNNKGLKKINLLYHEGHYNVITSLTSAFACSYFCEDCRVAYNTKKRHRCHKSCSACGNSPPCEMEGEKIKCNECNRKFKNQNCFEFHKTSKMCEKIKQCETCFKVLDITLHKNEHVCGEIFCKNCKAHMPINHYCFIKTDTRKPMDKDFLFIFYDFETRQEKPIANNENIKVHEPNLAVVQQCCSNCINGDFSNFCEKCGVKQTIIKEPNVIEKFMNYILQVKKSYKTVCCIAHNSQGFDVQFILKYILEKTTLKPDLIMRGTKIIQLTVDCVRFIDSLNFFPMALAKLPTVFKLSTNAKKGFFPHYFNTLQNQSYVGKIPDKCFYGYNEMMVEDRENFIKWHDEQVKNNYEFNMQKELVDYCISDVNILRESCVQFRYYFLQQCKTDPFLEGMTIASACNIAFRRIFLKEDTIGLIPPGGYRYREIQSKIALEWIAIEEKRRNITIQHAGRGKEKVINGVKIDGFDPEKQEIYEFQGCYFHGCPKCFPYQRDLPLNDDPSDSMSKRYERTVEKIERLRRSGYTIHEIWECQFRKQKKYMKDSEFSSEETPIDPRDAFYGGNTDCTKTTYKVGEGEKIEYVDVCSLYPWVCKYGKYPIGHPEIYYGEDCKKLVGDDNDLTNVEGIIKCTILPPTDLYHPVLPCKQNGKLIFSLCRTCSETENQGECTHTDKERALTETWVVDEVKKAVTKGYQVLKIFEIWQYKIDQYDPETKTGGLFAEYINKFLKIKQEASGFPTDCVSIEQKEAYIEEYFKAEGIKLVLESISFNPGLRSLAKLILNSFWGRFGMRENLPRTNIVRDPHEFFKLLVNPAIIVNSVQEVNEEVCVVNWEYKEEALDSSPTVNVAIAAYTTAQARLKLYSYLEVLGRQVLYYDTDSIIYSLKDGQHKVETGCFLGEMTNELESYGLGSYIQEFVSGGPKTYAYIVFSPTTGKISYVCKVKGLSLNFKASQIVNFETLKRMVTSSDVREVVVPSTSILRTKDKEVVTAPVFKNFKINVTKRRRIENGDTEPYGFKRPRLDD